MKVKANEILDSLIREYSVDDVQEVYKALVAYVVGLEHISEEYDKKLDEIIQNEYLDNDAVRSILNDDIFDAAVEMLNIEE